MKFRMSTLILKLIVFQRSHFIKLLCSDLLDVTMQKRILSYDIYNSIQRKKKVKIFARMQLIIILKDKYDFPVFLEKNRQTWN